MLCCIFVINIIQSQTLEPVFENSAVAAINKLFIRETLLYNGVQLASENNTIILILITIACQPLGLILMTILLNSL